MKFGAGLYQPDSLSVFEKPLWRHEEQKHELYIGMPQWSIPEWKGHFYPDQCQTKNFLSEYAKRLNSCEVSSTYYAHVSKQRWGEWQQQASDHFHFLPKWPKVITHNKKLRNCKVETKNFINSLSELGDNLGTTILQLAPSFSYDFKRELFNFLMSVPKDFPLAIEFRHSSWFERQRLIPKLENYLYENSISTVCSDLPAIQNVCHLSFTGKRNIVRFLSDGKLDNDLKRLEAWNKWLNTNNLGGKLYFMLHRPDNTKTFELIKYLDCHLAKKIEELNRGAQTDLFT